MNQAFYARVAREFSQTRNTAWPGWNILVSHINSHFTLYRPNNPITILDIGCGNGRFALFSQKVFTEIAYSGIDSSQEHLEIARKDFPQGNFLHQDILLDELPQQKFDIVVLFGVLHHIPSQILRKQILQEAAPTLKPHGLLIFTTWNFDKDEKLFAKRISPETLSINKNDLEENDYFLPWNLDEKAIRYCHLTTDSEAQLMIEKADLTCRADFHADGKVQNNHYYICTPTATSSSM